MGVALHLSLEVRIGATLETHTFTVLVCSSGKSLPSKLGSRRSGRVPYSNKCSISPITFKRLVQ